MSLIDALETENKQALGALQAVTAQRDRLREALRIVAAVADGELHRRYPHYPSVLHSSDAQFELGLLPGDLGESDAAVQAHRRREGAA